MESKLNIKELINSNHHIMKHPKNLVMQFGNGSLFCLTCALGILQQDTVPLKKKQVVGDLIMIFSSFDEFPELIKQSSFVDEFFVVCSVILLTPDELLIQKVFSLLPLLQPYHKTPLTCFTSIHLKIRSSSWSNVRNVIVFLGRLLCDRRATKVFIDTQQSLLEHLVKSGLAYPDEDIRSGVSYVLLRVCSLDEGQKFLSENLAHPLTLGIVTALCRTQNSTLQKNLLALSHSLISGGEHRHAEEIAGYFQQTQIATAVKNKVFCGESSIQISTIQLIGKLSLLSTEIISMFLEENIAELLLELLSGAKSLLLFSVLHSLSVLTSSPMFYKHIAINIESLFYVLEKSTTVEQDQSIVLQSLILMEKVVQYQDVQKDKGKPTNLSF